MSTKIYEHPGIKLEFKTPKEEANEKKLSPRDIVTIVIFLTVVFSLVFVAFFKDYGWWTLLILPVIIIIGFGIRLVIELSADPFSKKTKNKPLTENMKKTLKREFLKTFYTYNNVAITEHYIISPYSEKLNTVSISCIKIADIAWFYEYDMPAPRGYLRRSSVFNSKDKQIITLTDAKEQWNGVVRSLKREKGSRDYSVFRDMILKKVNKKILVGQSIENERQYYKIIGESIKQHDIITS